MHALIQIDEGDLAHALTALRSSREYVLAILASIERRKEVDAGEALGLLSRANALERARQALAEYKPAEVVPLEKTDL